MMDLLLLLLIVIGGGLAIWSILRWVRSSQAREWGWDEETGEWPRRYEVEDEN